MTIISKTYTFDPRPAYSLVTTVKRYYDPSTSYHTDPNGYTLIFTHGVGYHKEQWEPTIDDLFAELHRKPNFKLKEMWALDAPNHGDAAMVNEECLRYGYSDIFRWEEYARVLHLFLCGLGTGVDVDFSQHRLIGIGHSMGANAFVLSINWFPRVKFDALILVELMAVAPVFAVPLVADMSDIVEKRSDRWKSKEDAYSALKSRGMKIYDDRVLRLYIEFGMKHHDNGELTLKCPVHLETACHRDLLGIVRVYDDIKYAASQVPVHLIYGAISKHIPEEALRDFLKNAGGKHIFASVQHVAGAGHWVPQSHPTETAFKIHAALTMIEQAGSPFQPMSKL